MPAALPSSDASAASDNSVGADTVADIRPYVYKSGLFVKAPPMSGGTRQKVLNGVTMAKAVVSPGEKSQRRSDMSVAARHAANQKFNASRNYPQVPAVCKDAG